MPITFRHDAAGVVPPSNQATRKYGQQLVLQQQQQKYATQQAGYDRAFALERDAMQSKNQAIMQGQQNAARAIMNATQFANDQTLQETQNKFRQQQAEAEQQAKFMEDARKQSSGMIMDDIKNENYDPATSRKLQQNLVAESEAMGNPQLDATQRAEALAKIRAERAMLTASRMEKPPEAPPQPNFHTDQNGNQWVEAGPGKWNQVPKEEKPPMSAQEYYGNPKNEDKFQKDLSAKMQEMQNEQDLIEDPAKRTPVTKDSAWAQMQKDYDFRQKALGKPQYGDPTLMPANPSPPQASQGTERSILEQAPPVVPPANQGQPPQITGSTPTPPGMQRVYDGTRYYFRELTPEEKMQEAEARREQIPSDGVVLPPNQVLESPQSPQQVKVGGKPLAVTPGALTPQETAARGQIMELPREQRIAALMPYEPSLKGKTLEQLLEDPETKAGYAELAKQGLTTGNYREDMLGHLDEMLQNNVLNAGSKPDAYVGMNVNDIKDPKAKAELEKLPRPKSGEEIKTIRGSFFVDPNGVVRSTQKQV